MTADAPNVVNNEPTPEFNERCLIVVQDWQSGELPFKEAIARLTMYNQEAIAEGHVVNQARAEQVLGYIQHYRGNLTTSIQHWERARALYVKVGNRDRAATIDMNLGESYRYKGDFNRALRLYRAAYAVAEELGNLRTQSIAAVNEGLLLISVEQDMAGAEALEKGLNLTRQWPQQENDPDIYGLLCEIYHGLAVVHLRQDELDHAWDNALLALETANKDGKPRQIGSANRTMGEVVTRMKVLPDPTFSADPDDYFRSALEAFREVNAEAEIARTMFAQALSLSARGRRTTAARKLQQVMIIFTRLGMVDDAARAAEAQLKVL